jgi:predicted outer membrane repeat protein
VIRMTPHIILSSLILIAILAGPLGFVDISTTRYVKPGAVGNCNSWADACDLQTALGKVESGDQIWVAQGIYYPGSVATNSFLLKDDVALYGGFPSGSSDWNQRDWIAYPTILSGDIEKNDITDGGVVTDTVNIIGTNTNHVVTYDGLTNTILDGFIITAGNANGSDHPGFSGGGMYNESGRVTITNVTFSGNLSSWWGGGIYNGDGSFRLDNVAFIGNHSDGSGGGIYTDKGSLTLTNVTFVRNTTGSMGIGGGMCNSLGTVTLTNVTFTGNEAGTGDAGGAGGVGGGMFSYLGPISLTNVTFSDNKAQMGGGLSNSGGAILNNVTFSDNNAQNGGGMANGTMYPDRDTTILTNVTFSNNSAEYGGGMHNNGSVKLINVTFSGNSASYYGGGLSNYLSIPTLLNVTIYHNSATQNGGGIYCYGDYEPRKSYPVLTNTILWGNSPNQIYSDSPSSAIVVYSDIQGGWDGEGNIDMDPLLGQLADNGGFTLTHALGVGSPAIDTGSPINCPVFDQRGYIRRFDGDEDGTAVCDMGAFEYGAYPYVISAWLYLPMVSK